ncbi:MAG: 3'-5' exonuclease [Solirubrobacterales bacterium]
MDSFVAIDFETATWGAACAVGIVHFENGEAIEQRYTLLNPRISPRRWNAGAIRVHGIRPNDVIDAPTFADIWPELIHYVACYPLVAHNANFDIGVLSSELERGNLQSPTVRYACSMALARRAWPKRRKGDLADDPTLPVNHRLNTLSEFLQIELDHHNALSDAQACGEVALRAVEVLGHSTLAAACEDSPFGWGELTPELAAA